MEKEIPGTSTREREGEIKVKTVQSRECNWKTRTCAAIAFVILLAVPVSSTRGEVRVWEEPKTIPTYKQRAPELAPMFYHGRAYQGAEGHIYPYPFRDELTDKLVEKSYKAAYLENEYIKVCVLPEIGGRILSAKDKTNGYDFLYHQHVIKPALIGMLGAWISGGIEWDLPHHHRARVFEPMDYRFEEHPDGSKTIWIGELELRHRMRWIIGITLRPGRSYFEARVKIFNRTPMINSLLCFANVAVHTNENYRVIFPPDTHYVTYHGKNAFTTWPRSDEKFRGVDYTDGVDMRWWKNHPTPMSFFAWNYEQDFFGGYDEGKDAGIACVANHHLVPGKKFFQWGPGFGPNTRAAMWNRILTDEDGPYLELMTGAYSDNQPDYSWIRPYETKVFSWYWYPIRGIGNMKTANLSGALNLDLTSGGRARIAAYATQKYEDAVLSLSAGSRTILQKSVTISPAKPFSAEVDLSEGVKETDLGLSLKSPGGKTLLAYSPEKGERPERPETAKPPKSPDEIETVEELYLTGLRIEQFHNPSREPYPYYEEALKRDPENYRVTRSLGILYLKRGMLGKAEQHLRTAVKQVTEDYTSPRDGEALYYLGLILKIKGQYDEAYDRLYRATWSYGCHTAAYYHLAQIDCMRGDFQTALGHVNRSLVTNQWNKKAFALKCAVLRHLGRYQDAAEAAADVLEFDPLHPWAGYELYLAKSQDGSSAQAKRALARLEGWLQANKVQSYLELATNYGNCGMWNDAVGVLRRLVEEHDEGYPLAAYYLGYYLEKMGRSDRAEQWYRRGGRMSPDYCFPFRIESLQVLRRVTEHYPRDDRAHYYLGNLLYHYKQEEDAIQAWEQSRELNPDYAYVHRNLGIAYDRAQKELRKAISSYEKAIEANRKDPRFYTELGRLHKEADVSLEKRLDLFEANQEVLNLRDDALALQTQFYIQVGEYDKAIHLLETRHFRRWEGGGAIRDVYVNAYLLRGKKRAEKGDFQKALQDYKQALEYPDNIEAGKTYHGGRQTQINCLIAAAYERLGQEETAQKYYKKAVSAKGHKRWSALAYYEALARRKLGEEKKASETFDGLITHGKRRLGRHEGMDFFAKFGEKKSAQVQMADARYLIGLGHLGKGEQEKAREQFEKAVELDLDHVWAQTQLDDLKK